MVQGLNINTKSFNVTTSLKNIDLKGLYGSNKVVVVNEEIENGLFFNPNPAGTDVRTTPETITISDATGQGYACADTSKIKEGDVLEITQSGVVKYAYVVSIDPNDSFIVSEHVTPASTDTIANPPFKLPDGIILNSTYFSNGLLVKHKDNTDTTLYNLTIVNEHHLSEVKKN